MKIAILDDEKFFLDKFYGFLKDHQCFKTAEVSLYLSGKKLLADYEKEHFDIVFLDVEMPEISGIEIAGKIREQSDKTIIAFISSYPQYALDAFDCEASSYILKGEEVRFNEKLQKVYKKYLRQNKYILLETGTGATKVPLKEIRYIEYSRKYCIYHTESGKFMVRRSLATALSEISDFGFYQVYRCYIVNLNKIKEIQKDRVILFDDTKLQISRGSYTDVVNAYATYTVGVL